MKITPQISKDRLIRLKISQQINQLDQTAASTNLDRPTTLKRTIDTTVIVHDKDTIVIGGLIDDKISSSEYKMPCLGNIPGIGWLFKTMTEGNEKTNLFVFLTPHVIQSAEDAEEVLKKKELEVEEITEEGIKMYRQFKGESNIPEPAE